MTPTSTRIFTQLDLKPQSTHTYCAACTVLILKALLPLVQLQAALGISDFSAALGISDFSAALGLSRRLARARLAQALGTVCRVVGSATQCCRTALLGSAWYCRWAALGQRCGMACAGQRWAALDSAGQRWTALLVLAAVSSAGHLSAALGIGATQRWAALGLWQRWAALWHGQRSAALPSAAQRYLRYVDSGTDPIYFTRVSAKLTARGTKIILNQT